MGVRVVVADDGIANHGIATTAAIAMTGRLGYVRPVRHEAAVISYQRGLQRGPGRVKKGAKTTIATALDYATRKTYRNAKGVQARYERALRTRKAPARVVQGYEGYRDRKAIAAPRPVWIQPLRGYDASQRPGRIRGPRSLSEPLRGM